LAGPPQERTKEARLSQLHRLVSSEPRIWSKRAAPESSRRGRLGIRRAAASVLSASRLRS